MKNHSLKPVDFATLPQGPQGPKGDTGAPGKDATQVVLADASDSTATDVSIGSTNSIVDSHQLQTAITTSAPARIVAQAAITLKSTATTGKDASCKLSLDDPPPAVKTGTLIIDAGDLTALAVAD